MNVSMSLVDPVFRFVLESSLGACLVVSVILVLQGVFRDRLSPRWRYLLWGLLIARLMLPWMPQSPIGAAGLFKFAPPEAVVSRLGSNAAPAMDRLMPSPELAPAPTHIESPREGAPPREAQRPRAPIEAAPASPQDLAWAARFVWLAGCLLFGLHVLVVSWRMPHSLRRLRPVTDARILALFEDCRKLMAVKGRVALLADDRIAYPVVCGILRPRLVVPSQRLRGLSDLELSHVFLHELAHVKRHDLLVGLLTAGLQALHWFNPLVWYGFHRMRQDREFACDALALSRMTPQEADGYGHTLIKLMEHRARPVRLAGAAAILENASQLRRRIEMITLHKSSPYRLTWIGMALFVLCAATLLTRASANPAPTDNVHVDTATAAPAAMSALEPLPHVIPIELYQTEWSAFRPGDSIKVTELRGSSDRIEAGQTYQIKGHYVLASEDNAMLAQYCTNGDVAESRGPKQAIVAKGEGDFQWEFKLTRPGMLHVSYYPAAGGNGFGDCYYRQPGVNDGSEDYAIDPGSLSAPASPPAPLPHVIPIEMYETNWSKFRPGDSIKVTELRGSSPRIEPGQTYQVKGHYVLASAGGAVLSQYCTNGVVKPSHGPKSTTANKGEGDFAWEFKLAKPGMLHVTFYPANGGEGFGGCYYRQVGTDDGGESFRPTILDGAMRAIGNAIGKARPLDQQDGGVRDNIGDGAQRVGTTGGTVDLAVSDADFTLYNSDKWEGNCLNIKVRNNGTATSPEFNIWFYQGDPATTQPMTHRGGPLAPGKVWSEISMPVKLKEGDNTFYVKIDPNNAVPESDKTNNTAKLTVKGRKVMKEVVEPDKAN